MLDKAEAAAMRAIEPGMVMGKEAVDGEGTPLGEIVDVGLYAHDRVKFLLVKDPTHRVPVRIVGVDAIAHVSADRVRLSVA